MERIEKDRIAKSVLIVIQWVGHGRHGLILKDILRKRGLDVR